MFLVIYQAVTNPQFLLATFAALAVAATVYTLAQPIFERDRLAARIKSVALEREEIRARERARLADEKKRAKLRTEPKAYMRRIVDRFNLQKALADDKTLAKLRMAGLRGQAPLVVFLFARVTLPLVFFGRGVLLHHRGHRVRPVADGQDADRAASRRRRLLRAEPLHLQHRLQAPDVDPPRLAGCARPAADLRRIGHVGRGLLPQGVGGDRRPVDPARRGADAHHGRALLPSGAPPGV